MCYAAKPDAEIVTIDALSHSIVRKAEGPVLRHTQCIGRKAAAELILAAGAAAIASRFMR